MRAMGSPLARELPEWTDEFSGSPAITQAGAARSHEGLPAVVFDGDDTLWSTERLYDRARELAKTIVGTRAWMPNGGGTTSFKSTSTTSSSSDSISNGSQPRP